jgi:hypothetical protein
MSAVISAAWDASAKRCMSNISSITKLLYYLIGRAAQGYLCGKPYNEWV